MTIKWMLCTTCKNMVLPNDTQVCLSCQRGFIGIPQEDDCTNWTMQQLENRQKEIEDAIQKREAESLSLGNESGGCEGVCRAYAEGEKASQKGRKEAKKEEVMGMKIAGRFVPPAQRRGR